ncbi:hypothetical protein AB0F25_30565 [Streptomyces wedmorensis]|uniref:hypothetical protein n=1 Tax=Streptomyces wedmorensis TaxID=43759 RepID=UPI00344489AC
MAYEWQSVLPSALREPPGGIAPIVRIQFEKNDKSYDLKGELRGVEPVEEYGFDLGIRLWLRWGDDFDIRVDGVTAEIFDDTRDLCLRVPSSAAWTMRVEVPDPEPETPPEEPTEPEGGGEPQPNP